MEEILGVCQRDSWTVGRKRRIGHDVAVERFDVGDPWVFTASATVGSTLIIGLGLKRDAEPLDARWIASFIENHAGYADARIIILCYQSWEKIQLPIRPTNCSRI